MLDSFHLNFNEGIVKTRYLCGLLLMGVVSGIFAAAETSVPSANGFTPEQVTQIEKITHDYLVNHPQVLMEAGEKLQQQAMTEEKNRVLSSVPALSKEIFTAGPAKTLVGNPEGQVLMAEFSSYQCGHCRAMEPIVDNLLKTTPDLQVVFVEWPIFGNEAVNAAKMVVAAAKQGKYYELHRAFMKSQESLTPAVADKIALATGVDLKKLKADMNDSVMDTGLKNNFKLAEQLRLRGTPTFIFANRALTKFSLVPGQASAEDMEKAINEVK